MDSFLGQRIIKRIRQRTFHAIISQEIAFFDKTSSGELVNRLSSDTSLVGKAVTDNISDGLRALVQAVGGVSLMVSFFFPCSDIFKKQPSQFLSFIQAMEETLKQN